MWDGERRYYPLALMLDATEPIVHRLGDQHWSSHLDQRAQVAWSVLPEDVNTYLSTHQALSAREHLRSESVDFRYHPIGRLTLPDCHVEIAIVVSSPALYLDPRVAW